MIFLMLLGSTDKGRKDRSRHLDIISVLPRHKEADVRKYGIGRKAHRFLALEVDSSELTDEEFNKIRSYISQPETKINRDGSEETLRKNRYALGYTSLPTQVRSQVSRIKQQAEQRKRIEERFKYPVKLRITLKEFLPLIYRPLTTYTAATDPDQPVGKLRVKR